MGDFMNNLRDLFRFLANYFYHPILSLLYPNFCKNCLVSLGVDELILCETCLLELPKLRDEKHCKFCSSLEFLDMDSICTNCQYGFREIHHFERNISIFIYEDLIQEIIIAGKFGKRPSVWQFLGREMARTLQTDIQSNSMIIPVPISKKRLMERGFNQSTLLAKEISELLSVDYSVKTLIKIKDNNRQVHLSQEERIVNPMGCYRVRYPELIKDKIIYLVDDVYTTGSTVNECSRVLKEAGAGPIYSITVAKRD